MTTTFDVSVDPYISSEGVVPGLLKYASPNNVTISGVSPELPTQYGNTSFESSAVAVGTLIDAGFGTLVSFGARAEAKYFLGEYLISCGEYTPDSEGPDGEPCYITSASYSIGYRIGVMAWGLDTDLSTAMGPVAAQVSTSTASAAFSLQIFGIDLSLLSEVSALALSGLGEFNTEAWAALGQLQVNLIRIIGQQLREDTPLLSPMLTGVTLEIPDEVSGSRCASYCYALNAIIEQLSFEDAFSADHLPEDPPAEISEDLASAIYMSIVGSLTETPTDQNSEAAQKALFAP